MNAHAFAFERSNDGYSSPSMITKFRTTLADIAGIEIGPEKESLIRHRLNKRVTQTEAPDVESYLDMAMHDPAWSDELVVAIDLMTTNTTYFFREEAHYDFLAGTVVPDLAKEIGPFEKFQINVWSAASSEGAEAYTAAMVLSELKTIHPQLEYSIIGTDISPTMVRAATDGIYRTSQIEKIPEYLRKKYLLKGSSPDTE